MTLLKCRIYWVIDCDFAKSSVNDTFHDTSSDKLLQDITLTFTDICENWGRIVLACSSDFELQKLTYFFIMSYYTRLSRHWAWEYKSKVRYIYIYIYIYISDTSNWWYCLPICNTVLLISALQESCENVQEAELFGPKTGFTFSNWRCTWWQQQQQQQQHWGEYSR